MNQFCIWFLFLNINKKLLFSLRWLIQYVLNLARNNSKFDVVKFLYYPCPSYTISSLPRSVSVLNRAINIQNIMVHCETWMIFVQASICWWSSVMNIISIVVVVYLFQSINVFSCCHVRGNQLKCIWRREISESFHI